MTRIFRAVFVLTAALTVTGRDAHAQQALVSLAADDAKRFDLAGHVGWLAVNKSDIAPDWNDWYDAAAVGVSAGWYLTPNLKFEADVSTSTAGTLHIEEQIAPPGPYPYYPMREHRFRATTVAAGAAYQFFENLWFHPFVAAGVAATYESHRADYGELPPIFVNPQTRITVPPLPPLDTSSTFVHPFVGVGFKAYVSERAFIRADVRSTFSTRHVEAMVWRAGVGFDF